LRLCAFALNSLLGQLSPSQVESEESYEN